MDVRNVVDRNCKTSFCARDCRGGTVSRESAVRAIVIDCGYGVRPSGWGWECEMPRSEMWKVEFVLAGSMRPVRPAPCTCTWAWSVGFLEVGRGRVGAEGSRASRPACSILPTSQMSSFSALVSHERCRTSVLIMSTSSTRRGSFHHASLCQLGLEKASESWSRSSVWAFSDQDVMRRDSSVRIGGEMAVEASF